MARNGKILASGGMALAGMVVEKMPFGSGVSWTRADPEEACGGRPAGTATGSAKGPSAHTGSPRSAEPGEFCGAGSAAAQAPGPGTRREGNAPKGAHRLQQLGAQGCPKPVTDHRSHCTQGSQSAPTKDHRQQGARLLRPSLWGPAKRTRVGVNGGNAAESSGQRSSAPTRPGWVEREQAAVDRTTPARHGLVARDSSQPCGRPPGQDRIHGNRAGRGGKIMPGNKEQLAQREEKALALSRQLREQELAQTDVAQGKGLGLGAKARMEAASEQRKKDAVTKKQEKAAEELQTGMAAMAINATLRSAEELIQELTPQQETRLQELTAGIQIMRHGKVPDKGVARYKGFQILMDINAQGADDALKRGLILKSSTADAGNEVKIRLILPDTERTTMPITVALGKEGALDQPNKLKAVSTMDAKRVPANVSQPLILQGPLSNLSPQLARQYVETGRIGITVDTKYITMDAKVTVKQLQVVAKVETSRYSQIHEPELASMLMLLTHDEAEKWMLKLVLRALENHDTGQQIAPEVVQVTIQHEAQKKDNRVRHFHGFATHSDGPQIWVGFRTHSAVQTINEQPIMLDLELPGLAEVGVSRKCPISLGKRPLQSQTRVLNLYDAIDMVNQQRETIIRDVKEQWQEVDIVSQQNPVDKKALLGSIASFSARAQMLGEGWQRVDEELAERARIVIEASDNGEAMTALRKYVQTMPQQMTNAEQDTKPTVGFVVMTCSLKLRHGDRVQMLAAESRIGQSSTFETQIANNKKTDQLAFVQLRHNMPNNEASAIRIKLPADAKTPTLEIRQVFPKIPPGTQEINLEQILHQHAEQGQIIWVPGAKALDEGKITTVDDIIGIYGEASVDAPYDIRNIDRTLEVPRQTTQDILGTLGRLRKQNKLTVFEMNAQGAVGYIKKQYEENLKKHNKQWMQMVREGADTRETIMLLLRNTLTLMVTYESVEGGWLPGSRFNVTDIDPEDMGVQISDTAVQMGPRGWGLLLQEHPLVREAPEDSQALIDVIAALVRDGHAVAISEAGHTLIIHSDSPYLPALKQAPKAMLTPGQPIDYTKFEPDEQKQDELRRHILTYEHTSLLFVETNRNGEVKEIIKLVPGGNMEQALEQAITRSPILSNQKFAAARAGNFLQVVLADLEHEGFAMQLVAKGGKSITIIPAATPGVRRPLTEVWGSAETPIRKQLATAVSVADITVIGIPALAETILTGLQRAETRTLARVWGGVLPQGQQEILAVPAVHMECVNFTWSFQGGDTSHLEELLRHPAMNQKQDSLNQLAQVLNDGEYEIHDKPGGTLITSSPMTDIVKAYTEAYDFGNPFSLEQFKERVLQQQRAEARQAEQQQLQDMSKMGSDEAGDENMGEARQNENAAGSAMELGGERSSRKRKGSPKRGHQTPAGQSKQGPSVEAGAPALTAQQLDSQDADHEMRETPQIDVEITPVAEPRNAWQKHTGQSDRNRSPTGRRSCSPASRDRPEQSRRSRSPEERSRNGQQPQE